jgi:hypothetical protein
LAARRFGARLTAFFFFAIDGMLHRRIPRLRDYARPLKVIEKIERNYVNEQATSLV